MSVSKFIKCPQCQGLGKLRDRKQCERCNGSGEIEISPRDPQPQQHASQ